ncbi:metal tolerance protein 1-like [Corylus avellana]|uniref:metal tolerance protein 1-like n=1 Tax=Corylus avellana TaxID=13451 RepID=UPI00286B67EA|nr:metal tolerance protein 1-like [Corylus avellana]
MMEGQNSQNGQIIDISVDVPTCERSTRASKFCGEAACGFSNAGFYSKDAKERSALMSKLLMAMILCVISMSVEVVGGIEANSLAILTHATHLLSDLASFAISSFSLCAAGWKATPQLSYGFFRVEILGALVSILLIWLLAGIMVYQSILRLIHDCQVDGLLMLIVATFGLVFNIIMVLLLGHDHVISHSHRVTISAPHHHHHEEHPEDEHCHGHEDPADHHHGPEDDADHHGNPAEPPLLEKPKKGHEQKKWNINVQGAYLHVLGDSIQSIGAMIGGAIIWYKPEWKIVDAICTLTFSVIFLGITVKMIRPILDNLMESTPREIDATKLERGLLEMEEVVDIHELHIWSITVGKVLLACHVRIKPEANADWVLDNVINYIKREYNISHVTVQIER